MPEFRHLTDETLRGIAEDAARSMRTRAQQAASDAPGTPLTPAEAIAALPLLPDAEGEPCPFFTTDPADSAITVYCEHPGGDGHTGLHHAHTAGLTWGAPTGDFRTRLVSELLGEDRQDVADLLAEDPDATWEKAYACWSMLRAELERYRRGESPVLDRLAQLERDQGHAEKRLAALEELTASQADLLEKHSRALEPSARKAPDPEQRTAPIRYRDHDGHVWVEHGTGYRRQGYMAGVVSLADLIDEHGPLAEVADDPATRLR